MTELCLDQHQTISHFLNSTLGTPNYRVFQLAGDASSRRYFRVVHAETSHVLMVWEPFTDNDGYPFLSVLNHFGDNGIAVPSVFAKSPRDGLVLLEDLGDLTLERKFWENHNQDTALTYYKMTLDELYKIHFIAPPKAGRCTAFENSFNVEKLMWEFNYSMKHLVRDFCGITPTEEELQRLEKDFLSICEHLAAQKPVVCHRDFHSRNVMIKLGLVKIIDFQDARLGPIQYDLVSLLRDSYVNLEEKHQRSLLSEYLERCRSDKKITTTDDEFYSTYELQTIQRCFKACGSFASFYNLRKDNRYLKYIESTVRRVQRSLLLFPQYAFFQKFLTENGFFERKYEAR